MVPTAAQCCRPFSMRLHASRSMLPTPLDARTPRIRSRLRFRLPPCRAFADAPRVPQPVAFSSPKAKGDALELRVAAIARLLGHAEVRRNVVLRDAHGNRSEADVIFGRFFPTYVECKNYHAGATVGLEEVAKWRAVLELNGVPLQRGLFVTTARFSPRATTIGVRTLDGAQLDAWERSARLAARRRRIGWLLLRLGLAGMALTTAAVAAAPELERRWPLPRTPQPDQVQQQLTLEISLSTAREWTHCVLAELVRANADVRRGFREGNEGEGLSVSFKAAQWVAVAMKSFFLFRNSRHRRHDVRKNSIRGLACEGPKRGRQSSSRGRRPRTKPGARERNLIPGA